MNLFTARICGENMEERRDATCSAGGKSKEGRGDGPKGLPAPDKSSAIANHPVSESENQTGLSILESVWRSATRRCAVCSGGTSTHDLSFLLNLQHTIAARR